MIKNLIDQLFVHILVKEKCEMMVEAVIVGISIFAEHDDGDFKG